MRCDTEHQKQTRNKSTNSATPCGRSRPKMRGMLSYDAAWLVCWSVLLFTTMMIPTWMQDDNHILHHPTGITCLKTKNGIAPSLLELLDEQGCHVHALDNPLYRQIEKATFHNRIDFDARQQQRHRRRRLSQQQKVQDMRGSTLVATPSQMQGQNQPLTLQWTGNSDDELLVVDDNDIFIFSCADEEEDVPTFAKRNGVTQYAQILEAATVAQARVTSSAAAARHQARGAANGNNVWYIPRFPIATLRREACRFYLYRRGPGDSNDKVMPKSDNHNQNLYLKASSNLIRIGVESVTKPTGIHLAGSADATEMVVNFATGGVRITAAAGTPVAVYAAGGDVSKQAVKVTGTTTTYQASDMCMAPANTTGPGQFASPGMLHTVRLTNLQPDTLYSYKVGLEHGQGVTWSDNVYRFRSLPITGGGDDHSKPFAFLVYGDQGRPATGSGPGSYWTAAMAAREATALVYDSVPCFASTPAVPIRAVHHIGDLSYARGAAHEWEEWLNMIEPFAARVPLHVAVGNHEYDHTAGGGGGKDPSGVTTEDGYRPKFWGPYGDDSGGECGVPTAKRFAMPATGNGVFWYSHDFATLHTIVLSTEHDLSPGSRQHAWLEQDLQTVNRTRTPWLVVELHRPLYEGEMRGGSDVGGVAAALRYGIEDLLHDYQVDLVLTGHYHAYHRTCDGLYGSMCDNGGPMHLTIGTAGAELDDGRLFDNHWTAQSIQLTYGYGRITIMNATALHFEFVKAADEQDKTRGQVLDDVWVHRRRRRGNRNTDKTKTSLAS